MGYILLAGGDEFKKPMAAVDQVALALAGGADASVCIIPTAAVPDNNQARAAQNGIHWFKRLGARNVEVLSLVDRKSANSPTISRALESAQLIYLLGGFPGYLAQTLSSTAAWIAAQQALAHGAVIAGSSAGAMVLCDQYYEPVARQVQQGLGLLGDTCILPHHNAFGRQWSSMLRRRLPYHTLAGIDEATGVINDGPDHQWRVYGPGLVTIYRGNRIERYEAGTLLHLP